MLMTPPTLENTINGNMSIHWLDAAADFFALTYKYHPLRILIRLSTAEKRAGLKPKLNKVLVAWFYWWMLPDHGYQWNPTEFASEKAKMRRTMAATGVPWSTGRCSLRLFFFQLRCFNRNPFRPSQSLKRSTTITPRRSHLLSNPPILSTTRAAR